MNSGSRAGKARTPKSRAGEQAESSIYGSAGKAARDEWWRRFWQYLDTNPEIGQICRRWGAAGVDLKAIAVAVHRFATGGVELNVERRKRKKWAKKILANAVKVNAEVASFCRKYKMVEDAARFESCAQWAADKLSRIGKAYDTKHLGTARPWHDLAMIEGLIFEKTGQRPTAAELALLVKAAKSSFGRAPFRYGTPEIELLRKGLREFKKNNPRLARLWTCPSIDLKAIDVPNLQKQD